MAQISKKAEEKEKYFPPEIVFELFQGCPRNLLAVLPQSANHGMLLSNLLPSLLPHLEQSIANNKRDDRSHYLLYIQPYAKECYAYHDNKESFDKVFHRNLPMVIESRYSRPISSCNGLACITVDEVDLYGRVIYLWNPVIQKYKRITGTSCCSTMFNDQFTGGSIGFWYDDGKRDYKLIRIMQNVEYDSSEFTTRSQVELYSLNIGSWRKIDAKLPGIIVTENFSNQAFLNGTFNWIVDSPSGILSFDTSTAQFRKMELPKYRENRNRYWAGSRSLMVHKGCLALLVESLARRYHASDSWSVWVMNEFGVFESWVKKFTLVTKEKLHSLSGVIQNDESILFSGNTKTMYNLETDVIRLLPHDGSVYPWWLNYTESLVFLDEENEIN